MHREIKDEREGERERETTCLKGSGDLSGAEPSFWSLSDLASVTPLLAGSSAHLGALSCLGLHDTPFWGLVSSLANYHLSFAP